MATGDLSAQFDQLERDMQRVTDSVKREVGALIPVAAETMATALEARYPIGKTGRLRGGVRIRNFVGNDHLLPVKKVIGPPLAYIWQDGAENKGTTKRRNYSRKDANRGISPAHDPGMFQRIAVQTRTAMLTHAQTIVDRDRVI